ncbi:MAG: ABC transporter ATP-binding protein [Bacteroidetes bacterium]|nr:ABC transporter ATP-binding protein [Bacteroidota bacterium]
MLELRGVSKRFADFGLTDVSFSVEQGDYYILLGESGAGKSMVLETIAGLVAPDTGTILLAGNDITNEKIQNRKIGLVFQDHAVFPHLTVAENIAYSLHGAKLSKVEKHEKVKAVANELGIGELLARKPGTLSGGELQRVALGRTLIQQPAILLLDEPLSSLDTRLKGELRRLLRSIHRRGQTILHVTHDYEEALSLGTRIAVIHRGTIIQSGTPSEVFLHPKSEFVAHFIGVKNFFSVKLATKDQAVFADTCNNIRIRVVTDTTAGEGYILIRGEDILLSAAAVETSATNNFSGTVVEIVPNAGGIEVTIDAGIELHALITRESLEKLDLTAGKTCWVHFKASAVRYINK